MNQIKLKEKITRYIFSKKHFRSSNRTVKYNVFMPLNGETSVFLISGLSENEIWKLRDREATRTRPSLKGRADILALFVLQQDLKVNVDNNPIGHANIIGWPEEKSKQMSIAQELAADAHLHLKQ